MTERPDDLALALELADLADAITMARFRASDLRVDTKPDDTPVTDADRRVEQMVRERVQAARAGHAVLGEEEGSSGDAEWRWIVDPIDGTKNFARGVPVWATLLSLQHRGDETCAVVSAPALERRWWAVRGAGAHDKDGPLHVSTVNLLANATLSVTDVRDFARHGRADGFTRLADGCRVVRGFGDFWSHMLVAEGAIDCGVEPVVNEWDVSAVRLIVCEAGGRFSDFAGVDQIHGGNVVTTNGLLHEQVLACLDASDGP
ncbi:MAG: histidinol-phosphatase [Candidatus Dormibacteraeota bacterium]|uniref:Histidinol-phosphatase n=1 Tax=Candidatus Aeolococcus gillhamiae TaxID=3127015 RepID=A0A2W5ZDD2_9BACT|nr:histidinol-phosphatase [Candidatus Dormibacteraeota bacterium]PZR80935.1 MAG: histidinol-phosphatase [Candidatus Dormibacter sp. RRmetagenome_bin12]